jgi:hypothetical protein
MRCQADRARRWTDTRGPARPETGTRFFRAVASGAQGYESEIELLEENGILRELSLAATDHA